MTSSRYPAFVAGQVDEIEQALSRIATALLRSEADFLFGAGMSHSSGVPIGNRLAARLLRLFFPEEGSNPPTTERLEALALEYPFETIMQTIQNERGTRSALTESLQSILRGGNYKEQQEHRDLRAISAWPGHPLLYRVFTTNFDRLLELTFGDRGAAITESNSKETRRISEAGKVLVYYLHGTLDGDYVITEEDAFRSDYRAIHSEFLNALIQSDAFVFVGYSMSDPDFRQLYMKYREYITRRGDRNKKTYVVAPPIDEYSYRLGRVVWRERGAVWIPLTAAQFFSELKRYLETHTDRDVKGRILRKHNLQEDDTIAFDELVDRTQRVLLVEREDAIQFLDQARTRTGGEG